MVIKTIVIVLFATLLATMGLPAGKIVGGQFAEEHQFPYQVALFCLGSFRCGGSIIDEQWVLTAAHCVQYGGINLHPDNLKVYAGSSNLGGDGKFLEVGATFVHHYYGNFENDIALIKLKQKVVFDESMQKIDLYSEELKESDRVTISGFGRVGTGMPVSDQLKFNTMYVVREKDCYRATGIKHEGLVCFNSDVDNGACNGDSGGPAVYDGQLVGVANFVIDGCGTKYPDGYAKVSYYLGWIKMIQNSK